MLESEDDHTESSLLSTLELDELLWQKAVTSPTRPVFKHQPSQPSPVPAHCFPSLNRINHQRQLSDPSLGKVDHQRVLSSMSLKDGEFIQSDEILKPDLRITPRSPRFSVYISNDDYEVPESYQNISQSYSSGHSTFQSIEDISEDGIDFEEEKEHGKEPSSSYSRNFTAHPKIQAERGHKHSGSISSIISGVKSRSAYIHLGLKKHKSSKSAI